MDVCRAGLILEFVLAYVGGELFAALLSVGVDAGIKQIEHIGKFFWRLLRARRENTSGGIVINIATNIPKANGSKR
jgi:hypothetical protein